MAEPMPDVIGMCDRCGDQYENHVGTCACGGKFLAYTRIPFFIAQIATVAPDVAARMTEHLPEELS